MGEARLCLLPSSSSVALAVPSLSSTGLSVTPHGVTVSDFGRDTFPPWRTRTRGFGESSLRDAKSALDFCKPRVVGCV